MTDISNSDVPHITLLSTINRLTEEYNKGNFAVTHSERLITKINDAISTTNGEILSLETDLMEDIRQGAIPSALTTTLLNAAAYKRQKLIELSTETAAKIQDLSQKRNAIGVEMKMRVVEYFNAVKKV